MKAFLIDILHSETLLVVLFYLIYSLTINLIDDEFVSTDEVYTVYMDNLASEKYNDYDEYIEDFDEDLAELDLEDDDIDWEGLMYQGLFVLIESVFSIFLVAIILYGIIDLIHNPEDFSLSKVIKPVIFGNLILTIPQLLAVIWFLFFHTDYTFEDIQAFKPLSLEGFLLSDSTPYWQATFISLLNVFEPAYVLVVAWGIQQLGFQTSYSKIAINVAGIYLTLIFFWKGLSIYLISIFS